MKQISANFDFLAPHDAQLMRLGALAERYFKEDPNTCLIKLRQFGEVLAQLTAAKSGLLASPEEPQADLLRRLKFERIVPREVGDLFHQLRIAGNRATHDHVEDHAEALTTNHVMHLNPHYVLEGELELSKLFLSEEIQPDRLLTQSIVSEVLNDQYRMLSQAEPPNIETGTFCKRPHRCEFFEYCHPALDQDDVRSLPIPADKIRMLLHNGLISISELPTAIDLGLYWHLTKRECSRIDAARRASPCGVSVDPKLRTELAALEYPVCFMDFETVASAVPRFRGMKPYEPIPIQWSVHRQAHEGGTLEHSEFLSPDRDDPRTAFIKSLSETVAGARTVAVYGAYENTLLSHLSRWLPEYALKINSIKSRLVDLLSIIRENVYSPAFLGSYSIKRVLPVLVPGMSYDDLAVKSGDQVAGIWEQLCAINVASAEKAQLRKALLDYCARDTLALANLVDALRRHADSPLT